MILRSKALSGVVGNPSRALAAPKHSIQRQLVEGLRYLVNEQLKLNQPRASDGWLTDDALWLVSKPYDNPYLALKGSQLFKDENSCI